MTFRAAMISLTARPTRNDVAVEAGVSYHSVRQALLPESSTAHRGAPPEWEDAVAALAEREGVRLLALASTIRGDTCDFTIGKRPKKSDKGDFERVVGAVDGIGRISSLLRIPKAATPEDLQLMIDACRESARSLSLVATELDGMIREER